VAQFQKEKQLVRTFYAELDAADPSALGDVISRYTTAEWFWRGYHPFNEQQGAAAVAEVFWKPLRESFSHLQRREDIFMAGHNHYAGHEGVWVISMGHLMGLFDAPWLNIPATRKIAMLRYCEFNKVENGKIVDTALFIDIPQVMMQAGLHPFPAQTGAQLVQPGPITHQGLMYSEQDPAEGEKTLDAINFMANDIKTWRGGVEEPLVDELRRSWNEDMIWWGPAGIGATYTIERYAEQHSGPFRAGFKDRTFNGHVCRIAEGHFGGFFGWPNLTLTPSGGFMGMPASEKPGDMRVIDMYRRQGDKLTENWIFIDLLHFWMSQGLDVLGRLDGVGEFYRTQ